MKRFKFRLQTVLDQRRTREERLQIELGALQREGSLEASKLAALVQSLGDAVQAVESALRESAAPDEIARSDDYAKCLRDDVKLQQLTLRAVRSRVEAKRGEVVEAMKERKVLEALRDKQKRDYIAAQTRAEQNQLDDVATVRYAREV